MTILYGGAGGGLVEVFFHHVSGKCKHNYFQDFVKKTGYLISYMSLFVKTKTIERSMG